MKKSTYTPLYSKAIAAAAIVLFPFMVSCSVLGGGSSSNDPMITAKEKEIELLEQEVKQAEQYAKEADLREKAAKDRLKAAKHELKAMESESERRGY